MMGDSPKAENLVSCGFARSFHALRTALALAASLQISTFALPAQQTAANPAQQPKSNDAQLPGSDAQVHTGISSGLDANARLQNLFADHQFIRLEEELSKLPPDEAQFYNGLLANRTNDSKRSIALLEPLVEKVAASGDTAREKLLRKALAEDYLRSGDWAKAATAYQTLETRLGAKLSSDEQDEIEMPLKMLPLAKNNPAMSVEPCDPFIMQVEKNPLGLTDVPVFVDALPHAWMLDPTAPFNLIARSTARQVGLKISEETATIRTLTGKPIRVHVTVIPRFTLAGKLTLRNVTAFVFDDDDYAFPVSGYRVQGVLGYPGVSALGSLTITDNDTIAIHPDKQIASKDKEDLLTDGARFFLDGNQIIVALGKVRAAENDEETKGEERMFILDAGGQQTYLTSRYFNEHSAVFEGKKAQLFTLPNLDLPPQPAYLAETVPLAVGSSTVRIHYVQILTQPLGNAALDDVYGVLGIDALDQLASYTFDYRTMRFTAKPR